MFLQPVRNFTRARVEDVGEPLFLTPYIEAGDLETARSLARVDASLLEVKRMRERSRRRTGNWSGI